jgi:pimeloyl-ACP methyl ester carboxylesterase
VTEPETHTVDVAGAVLRYGVREVEASAAPTLMMIGSPMDASGFASLVEHFRDRTVVTYDPRGVGRSQRTDGASWSAPEQHADDLHRLTSALGGGPVHIFASSGGAVNGLALVARHPEQVRTLVAHEPPAATALPDREQALAAAAAPDRPARRHPPGRGDQHPALASPRHRGRWPGTGCAFPTAQRRIPKIQHSSRRSVRRVR